MQRIGEELQSSTGAFNLSKSGCAQFSILDLCMAPGGFLDVALKSNPGARALGFSLPTSSGGHKVLLPRSRNTALQFLDVTMLAADIGVTEIPEGHPDAGNFLPRKLHSSELFDLVLCDGQVLRTHNRAPYREQREARRLTLTQLALGLQHLRPGGTMIVLLHRVELWDTVCLLYKFNKFSSVKLFKPTIGHAKRSSFYMVATGVQSLHSEALLAIQRWRVIWRTATFGTDEEYENTLRENDVTAEEVLEDFGEELVRLGKPVWNVQVKALAQAPFINDQKALLG